jgi:hypothetical protein
MSWYLLAVGVPGIIRERRRKVQQRIGELRPLDPAHRRETLGMVGFSIVPHLDHEDMPNNAMVNAERWAAGLPVPGYAIDDQTAIKVIDGTVEVISEGHWNLFAQE